MSYLRGYFRLSGLGKYMGCTHRALSTIAAPLDVDRSTQTNDYVNAKPFSEIPGPRVIPIFGTTYEYLPFGPYSIDTMFEHAFFDKYRKYGTIWKEKNPDGMCVFVIDPGDLEKVYKNDGKTPIRSGVDCVAIFREKAKLSPGVANLQGEDWRRIRSGVQRLIMRPKEVATFVPELDTIADDFIHLMTELRTTGGEIPDFQGQIYKWALESVTTVALDTRMGCLTPHLDPHSEPQQMIDAVQDMFTTMAKLTLTVPIYKLISTATWRKFVDSQEVLLRITKPRIDAVIERIREGNISKGQNRVIVSLVSTESLSYEDIVVLPMELMVGGVDSTSHTLVFNLYQLATHPDKQAKLHKEVNDVIPPGEPVTSKALMKMHYLKACIKETFRLLPLTVGNGRIITKDLVLNGYQVPAGTLVISPHIAARLPEYFPSPDEFIPERWMRGGDMESDASGFALLPFGFGPRMCLGRRVAEQELQILLVKLVEKFRIEWHHGKMGMINRLFHKPDKPARFTFIDREQ